MGSYAVISSVGTRDSDQLAIRFAWPRSTWNGPLSYRKDVMERLPTQPASRLEELLPHRWKRQPAG